MAWPDDRYTRGLLDAREKWSTVLSMTAMAGLVYFLSDHPHCYWLKLSPLAVGAFGTFYVFVVNCYYEQAEAIANARSEPPDQAKLDPIIAAGWIAGVCRIGFLGWMNTLAPLLVGVFATLALCFGLR